MTGLFSLYHPVINPLHHKKTMAMNLEGVSLKSSPSKLYTKNNLFFYAIIHLTIPRNPFFQTAIN